MSKILKEKSGVYSSICLAILVGLLYEPFKLYIVLTVGVLWSFFVWHSVKNNENGFINCIVDIFVNIAAVSVVKIISSCPCTLDILICIIVILFVYAVIYCAVKKFINT